MRVQALGDAGGVNSINNFARSWQRAAGFFEITPARPSFRVESDDEQSIFPVEGLPGQSESRSLLRATLQQDASGRRTSDDVFDEETGPSEETLLLPPPVEERIHERRSARDDSIFSIEPSLASPFGGSYGTSYGSLTTRVNESSMRHAGRLFREQQLKGASEPDKEREPLVVKQIEEDGHIIHVVVGQSTLPQTIFNSVNVLIGVGLLALPLAMKYSGWVIGMIFFLYSAVVTAYTAKLLAKCLDVDSSLITFADLAYVSFGHKARIATSILFTVELLAACVALVILFADSLDDLIPGYGILAWKIVCGIVLVPLGFLPLRLLSFTSVLGILSCLGSKSTPPSSTSQITPASL
jgi:vesicular inhibitory amino acid transporter